MLAGGGPGKKMLLGGQGNLPKLKASPAGGARIMRMVMPHLRRYGPTGVPKGRVVAQKRGQGRTP